MTSLQEQLKRLAVPQGRSVAAARDRRHKSILFDPKEAAGLDKDTIYAIGVNGLQELQTIDQSFEEFESTLFSEGSKTLERSVQTDDVNKVLNRQIRTFLLRLSPYFTLKPAQKTLEWLVYRFAIHEYNMDEVMMCIIPYHTTKLFVRVVQLFSLKDKTHIWHWLRPIQEPGVPLARPTVLTHCYKDPAFLQFVCNLVPTTTKAYKTIAVKNPAQAESALRLTFSFYASTVIGAMEQSGGIQEEFLANLVPFLIKGLRSAYLDYKAASLMVISQLCARAKLEARLLHPIMEAMCKKSDSALEDDLVSCLAVMYQTQDFTDMQDSVFQMLSELPDLIASLGKLNSSRDISPLLQVLLQRGVTVMLSQGDREGERVTADHNRVQVLLEGIVSKIDFKLALARSFIKYLLKHLLKANDEIWNTTFFITLINNLEKKYPEAMDTIIQNQASKKLSSQKERRLQTFMQMTASGSKHQVIPEVETSLVLSLNHPGSDNRELAVKHLYALNKSGQIDPEFLQSSLSLRIEDSDQKVILAVLEFGDVLCEVLSPDPLMTKLEQHLSKWHRKTKDLWPQVASTSLDLLTSGKLWWSVPAKDRAAAIVLPYLLPSIPERAAEDADMFHQIVTSDLGKSHDLFKGLHQGGKMKKGAKHKKTASQILEQVAHNLSGYPTEARLQLVKFLVEYSGTHHLPEAYKLTVSLILIKLLRLLEKEEKLDIAEMLLSSLAEDLGRVREKTVKGELPQIEGAEASDDIPTTVTVALGQLLSQRTRRGDKVSSDWLSGSLWCLGALVNSVEKTGGFGGDQWLHFETTSAQGRYLMILVKLFDLLTSGVTSSTDTNIAGYFKNVLGQLVQTHFTSCDQLWSFLSALCLSHFCLHGDSPHANSYMLQICCLQMANISLASAGEENLARALQEDSVVFPCLLLNLGHPSESVRRVAVECLSTIQGGCRATTPYSQLMKAVLKREGEIIVDQRYLQQALRLAIAKLEGGSNKRRSKVTEADNITDWLAGCITAESTPKHVRCALMEMLSLVESKALLTSVIPSLTRAVSAAGTAECLPKEYNYLLAKHILAHFRPDTAEVLQEESCRDAFWLCLSQEHLTREGISLQAVALEQVTADFFLALPSASVQQELFRHLVDLSLETKSAETVKLINRILRKLPLSSELMISELNSLHPDKNMKTLHDARESRRRKQQKRIDQTAAKVTERSWERATFVLELLQQRKLSKMEGVVKIVPTLFSILALCLEADDQLDSHEYIKQLVLTLIHSICQLKDDQSTEQIGILKEEQFNVELVVQCVRTSDNPQTHNHALLVLTVAAQLFPEHLLHNIMSIFTFMGASVLRQDDGYSFQVINKTLQTVIPALLKANSDGSLPTSIGASVHSIVFMIIRVFVDAFPHIPDHRKLPLFTQLIETVHPGEYLWSCIVVLVESFALKGPTALYPEEDVEESKGNGRSQLFWQSLCLHFSPAVQISSITRMFQFLLTLPEDSSSNAPGGNQTQKFLARLKKLAKAEEYGFDKILDMRRFTGKQLRQFKFTLVGFFSQLLSCDEFVAKVASLSGEEKTGHQDLYQTLLEENLRFAQRVAQSGENNAENATAKFWKALLHRTYDVLDKVNALLPGDVFIRVVSGLLSNELSSVRRKAMELLNNVLVQHRQRFTEDENAHLLGLVNQLIKVAESSPMAASPEVDVNRQTALYSLKLLCKLLGGESPREFTPVLALTLKILQTERSNVQLVSSALLCLAETVSCLRAHSIPHLSHMVPTILTFLAETSVVNSSNLLLLCCVTTIQKIVETLPNFMSPYVRDILSEICRLSCNKDDEKTQLNLRLRGCRQMLSKKLPSRVLLPAVAQTYSAVEGSHRSSVIPLMTILEEHISTASREDILSHHSSTMTLFLEALDFRTKHIECRLEEAAEIEGAVIRAILMHTMKLSETTFRPMYYQMFDWASRNDPPKSRLLTFYNLSDAIAEKLKSIFSLFAGHIVPNAAGLLDVNNSAKGEEQFFSDDSDDDARSNLLVQLILSCLSKCFLHDKGAFVNKERFELLSQPLIDQLENVHGSESDYEERVAKYLGPCITALLSSVGDLGIWQPINYQLLLKMRHSSSKIRYAALVVLDQVHESMKESYLSLLPETIPFLAELMEDESEEVEKKCHELVKDFEKTLGEPLQKHF